MTEWTKSLHSPSEVCDCMPPGIASYHCAAAADIVQGSHKSATAVVRATGEILLKVALGNLLAPPCELRKDEAYVYMALMAATDAGYKCGVTAGTSSTYETDIEVRIQLPCGTICIEMPQFGEDFAPTLDRDSERIARDYVENI